MHRLPGDEIFHFYLGDPVEMLQLFPDGRTEILVLGADLQAGQKPQHVVPAGVWQGSSLLAGGKWALLGATMAPGFDYADYEQGQRELLSKQYPEQSSRITRLTRN
jgi:predicted cupin superfamily sugar epimerase